MRDVGAVEEALETHVAAAGTHVTSMLVVTAGGHVPGKIAMDAQRTAGGGPLVVAHAVLHFTDMLVVGSVTVGQAC